MSSSNDEAAIHPREPRGHLYAIGVGPGDPELLTVKAVHALCAADVVAYHQAPGHTSHALHTVTPYLDQQRLLTLEYPVTTGSTSHPEGYQGALAEFYDTAERLLRAELAAGKTVALIAAGDPLIYSSQQHLSRRLAGDYPVDIIPGISSFQAAAAVTNSVLCEDHDVFRVVPATLPLAELTTQLRSGDPLAVLKLGRTTETLVSALRAADRLEQALVVMNASTPLENVVRLTDVLSRGERIPYFSVVLLPSATVADGVVRQENLPAEGCVDVVGLGPGDARFLTPDTADILTQATDVVGYGAYTQRVALKEGQRVHSSGNMVELERARLALDLAASGKRVVVVSSGDPGVFGMATALMEVLDTLDPQSGDVERFAQLPIEIHPGVTAALAAAALVGAPLGHDFAVLSLSDRLKPWETIAQRVQACCTADLAFAVYNPKSRARPHQIDTFIELLRRARSPETLIIKVRAVGCEQEQYSVSTLADFTSDDVDMRTVLIVGSSRTRRVAVGDRQRVYTPRRYD